MTDAPSRRAAAGGREPRAWVREALLWGPAVAYMAVIFYLSSLSQAPLPATVSDKLAHACGYAGLGLLVARAVGGGGGLAARGALTAFGIAVAYGASDEVHQMFVPGRSADVRDWYADAIGAALGIGAWILCGIIAARVHRLASPRRAPS